MTHHPEIELAKQNANEELQDGWKEVDDAIDKLLDSFIWHGDDAGFTPLDAREKVLAETIINQLLDDESFIRLVARQYERQQIILGLDA